MKKLLTMMVSCASALFAMADVQLPTGTDFESYKVNDAGAVEGGPAIPLNINKDDNGGDGDRYWYSKTSTEGIVEAAVTNNGTTAYLMLDTSEVLERTIGGYSTVDGTTTFASTNLVGGAIYFDSMVQFTATEDAVTPTAGDKLVVWLQAVEAAEAVMDGETEVEPPVSASTNLMITAGVPGEGTSINPVSYKVTNISVKPNDWARLTIKSFLKDGVPYFSVFVNGVAVDTEVDNEFLSLVDSETEGYTTITSVGFKGNGAVDDLVFTKTNPLGTDVTINVVDDEGYCKKIVYGEQTFTEFAQLKINVPVGTTEVSLKCYLDPLAELVGGTKKENDVDGNNVAWTWTGSITDNTITLTINEVQTEPEPAKPFSITIGDKTDTYETLADAIAAATAGDTIVVAQGADGATSYNIEGIKIEKSIIINLNGNTLVLNKPAVGATEATQTLGIRIEGPEKSLIDVTIMNGEIEISEANLTKKDETDKQIKMMINNYANLTLDSVILDGTNLVDPANNQPKYVLSNNRGNVLLKGTTSIIVPTTGTSVAFDVCKFQDYVVPTVTLKLDEGYTIGGDVEVTGGNFVYEAGEISGAIKFSSGTIKGVAKEDITVVPGDKVLGTNTDGAWILVDKPADPEPEEPTIGDTEVKFDETGVITNITTAANKMDVSGVADINAFLAKFEGCYTVSVENGKLNIALNDNAKPVIGEADIDSDETEEPAIQIVDGQFKVTIQDSFKSLKYKLQYKAGLGNNPETGKPYDWTEVATDEVGTKGGAMQLSAPATADKGFYRVVVTE